MTQTAFGRGLRAAMLAPLVLFASASAASSCSSSSGQAQDERGPSPCLDELADECGGECSVTGDCSDGLYCNDGSCFADCTPDGNQCRDDEVCNAAGACIPSGGIFGNLDGGGSDGNPVFTGDGCVSVDVGFEKQTPTVLLLVDQSGSMTSNEFPEGSGVTRWDALRDSLLDGSTGVVSTLQADVRFGLTLYSSDGGNAGGQCPMLTKVAIRLNNYNRIRNTYQAADTIRDTPTAESVADATADLTAFNEPGDKFIVLATDGNPDNCVDPDAHDQGSQDMVVSEVQAAARAGIRTFVISVGTDVTQAHLQDVANAGLGRPLNTNNDAPFWVATEQTQLSNVFRQIIGGVVNCRLDLDGSVDEDQAAAGVVTLGGDRLTLDDPDGWQLNSPTQIELVGQACEDLKEGDKVLSIRFPCGAVTIPQ